MLEKENGAGNVEWGEIGARKTRARVVETDYVRVDFDSRGRT